MAPQANVRLEWHGEKIRGKGRRAVERAMQAWGAQVVADAKNDVHRLTGTLSRTLHTASRSYKPSSDQAEEGGGAVATGDLPEWEGDNAFIVAGSWISYAIHELRRGGAHDFLSRAVNRANGRFKGLLQQAFGSEGLK